MHGTEHHYLIPFDQKYFLLGINLIQGFKNVGVDAGSISVVDFGLRENQMAFLRDFGIRVLKIPKQLKGAPPFKLKSSLALILAENNFSKQYLVQLDADMLLLKNPESELSGIFRQMASSGAQIALCPDTGHVNIDEFSSMWRCTKFRSLLSNESLKKKYLNTGFVVFAPTFDFAKFQAVADQIQDEAVWEQNAVNVMCYENNQPFLELKPEIWNVHGKLLQSYSEADDPFIIHLTAPTARIVNEATLTLNRHGKNYGFLIRLTSNKAINDTTWKMLQDLINKNTSLFEEHLLTEQKSHLH